MTSITIKNIPDDLYAELKRQAEANRRSLNSEAIVCLERAVRERPRSARDVLADIDALRRSVSVPPLTDEWLREAIDRDRE